MVVSKPKTLEWTGPVSRRGAIVVALLAMSACATPQPKAGAPKTVLFVCQYGSVKSAVARELARREAAAQGVDVQIISRGLTPGDHMSPELAKHLADDGIDAGRDGLAALDGATLAQADVVVLFDALPAGLTRPDARDWSDTPSMNQDYAAARAVLDKRIAALMGEVRDRAPRSID